MSTSIPTPPNRHHPTTDEAHHYELHCKGKCPHARQLAGYCLLRGLYRQSGSTLPLAPRFGEKAHSIRAYEAGCKVAGHVDALHDAYDCADAAIRQRLIELLDKILAPVEATA